MGWEQYVTQKLEGHPQVSIFLSDSKITPPRSLTEKLVTFSLRASQSLRTSFWRTLDEYQQTVRPIDPRILAHLRDTHLDCANFDVYDKVTAQEVFASLNFEGESIHPKSALLVFNLPRPLMYFYSKRERQLGEFIIPWGNFYKQLQKKVWETVKEAKGLEFNRINGFGEHDPRHYYYLWEVSLPPTNRRTKG